MVYRTKKHKKRKTRMERRITRAFKIRKTRRIERNSEFILKCAVALMFESETIQYNLRNDDSIVKIKDDLRKGLKIIFEALTKPGSIYVFGDGSHGYELFKVLDIIYPCLNNKQKNILDKSHYFTEKPEMFGEFHGRINKDEDEEKFFPMDVLCKLDTVPKDKEFEYDAKRIDMANNCWSKIIAENLTTKGVNFICVGRTHLYENRGIREDEVEWSNKERKVALPSFQNALHIKLPRKTIKSCIFVGFADPDIVYSMEDAPNIIVPEIPLTKFIF